MRGEYEIEVDLISIPTKAQNTYQNLVEDK